MILLHIFCTSHDSVLMTIVPIMILFCTSHCIIDKSKSVFQVYFKYIRILKTVIGILETVIESCINGNGEKKRNKRKRKRKQNPVTESSYRIESPMILGGENLLLYTEYGIRDLILVQVPPITGVLICEMQYI
jgi:hypothetical protein